MATLLLNACRTDDQIVYMEDEDTGVKAKETEVVCALRGQYGIQQMYT